MFNSSSQLKKLRQFLKLTQDDFAEKINTKRNSISMIESGRNKPTFDMVGDICEAFNISADYFLSDKNPEDLYNYDGNIIVEKVINNNVNNDYLNSPTNDYLNRDNAQNLQNNKNYIESQFKLAVGNDIDPLARYYTNDPVGIKAKKLIDLKEKYTRRFNREAAIEDENLYTFSHLVDHLSDTIDMVLGVYMENINNRPDPFDILQYYDLQHKTINIPDEIDYKEYKASVLEWLNQIKKLQPIINEYYQQSLNFLSSIEATDSGK